MLSSKMWRKMSLHSRSVFKDSKKLLKTSAEHLNSKDKVLHLQARCCELERSPKSRRDESSELDGVSLRHLQLGAQTGQTPAANAAALDFVRPEHRFVEARSHFGHSFLRSLRKSHATQLQASPPEHYRSSSRNAKATTREHLQSTSLWPTSTPRSSHGVEQRPGNGGGRRRGWRRWHWSLSNHSRGAG